MPEVAHHAERRTPAIRPSTSSPVTSTSTTRVQVGAAAALALVLCVAGLSHRPLWVDEAFSLAATRQLRETLEGTAATMSLYYVLLDGWAAAFGTSARALRSMSVVFAVLTIPLVARLARSSLRRAEIGQALIIVALMPSLARFGQESRSYALAMLLTACSWVALLKAVENRPGSTGTEARPWWILHSVLSVAGVLSHSFVILQVMAQAASLLVLADPKPIVARFVRSVAPAVVIVTALSLAGLDVLATWIPPIDIAQIVDVGSVLFGPIGLLLIPLTAVSAHGAIVLVRRSISEEPSERWSTLFPVAWALIPVVLLIAISVVRPYLIGRYLVPSAPALALLASVGVSDLDRRIVGRRGPIRLTGWRRLVGRPVATVLVALLVWGQVQSHRDIGYDWRGAAGLVAARVQPGDGLVFPNEDFALPFDAAWQHLPDEPTTEPAMIYPATPLGSTRRFASSNAPTGVGEDWDRVWVAHRTMATAGNEPLDAFLQLLDDEFDVVERFGFTGGVEVVLAVRR